MKEPSHLNYFQIENVKTKLRVPDDNTFVLDSVFRNFYEKIGRLNEQVMHDHVQPLQINVYNANGQLISFHINCYAGGLIHLRWNVNGRFDSIPPKTAIPVDTTMNASRHLSMILNYKTGLRLSDNSEKYDYLFVVHWCVFWKRQSKGLVKFVEKYKLAHREYKIKVVYVNDDNLYN